MQTLKPEPYRTLLFFSFLSLAGFGHVISAEEPLLVTISKETTRITAPLKSNGYPDYIGALNLQQSKGVNSENNLAISIWNTVGTANMSPKLVKPYFRHLHMSPPTKNATYYLSYYQWFEETFMAVEMTSGLTAMAIDDLRKSLEQEYEVCMEGPWTAEQFPKMARWLKINHHFLADFISATHSRSRLYNPYVIGPDYQNELVPELIGVLLPAAQHARELARGMRLLANNQIATGNMANAIKTSNAIHRLGRLSTHGATLVEGLVGIAVDHIGFTLDELIIKHENLTDSQLQQLSNNLRDLPPISKLADKIDVCERYMFLDTTIALALHGPQTLSLITHGDSSSPPPALRNIYKRITTAIIDWDHILRTGNYWYDEFKKVNSIESPQQRKIAFAVLEKRITKITRTATEPATIARQVLFSGKSLGEITSTQFANMMVGLLLPALEAAIRAETRNIATHQVTLAAIAVARYKLQHERYPDNLAAIKGIYIDTLPNDPFTARPLTYLKQEQGFILYSFGDNMKDDKGHTRAESGDTNPDSDDISFRIDASDK